MAQSTGFGITQVQGCLLGALVPENRAPVSAFVETSMTWCLLVTVV